MYTDSLQAHPFSRYLAHQIRRHGFHSLRYVRQLNRRLHDRHDRRGQAAE